MVGSIPQPGDEHPLNGKPWGAFGGTNTVRLEGIKVEPLFVGDATQYTTCTYSFTAFPEPPPAPPSPDADLHELAEGQRHREQGSTRTVHRTYTLAPRLPLFAKLAIALAVLLAAAWLGMGRWFN